ncbi:unnamed protein product [Porites evermanni]|uniref:UPF0547 domain-containing protein n=1 Tax=Porites evermanni TaxID=104178 RepID=A0ABN8NEB4_9CNID|nr:unnamed protein product [Porites evermanni]
MVVKRCPNCDQTLPVACKSCPCGHVFISRKLHQVQVKKEQGEGLNGSERDKRLRPERPKKENPDFDYEFSLVPEDLVERIKTEQMPCPLPQQSVVNLENVQEKQINLPQLPPTLDGVVLPKKRGRPKGSKNKVKTEVSRDVVPTQTQPVPLVEDGVPVKRKRGRPKGSKNKPKPQSLLSPNKSVQNNEEGDDQTSSGSDNREPVDVMPYISREKAEMYSLILMDINQKMISQSCMKFV